ncbi:Endo alpha-1-4 polygalactosaminidase precursor [Penicillium paradoxum]|uniref:Endo alpha-1-4 polygalactosaminidase precursor n=1 Tax=Penicillium paradoxum TaxID=176176 RepID=UPI002547A402|nr:Endo alpha-1-4 polygalactosaminidase precursor [Penicillium paradoxum]KAJ5780690.1 Endo alpha-1-4 polygalactosaminidase precursor [Penicillium paradoxum]
MSAKSGWWAWSTKKKVLVLGTIALVVIGLGVGLGAGLGIGLKGSGDDDNDNETGSGGTNTTTPTTPTTPTNTTVKWQPAVGTKWQIVLKTDKVITSVDAPVYDIDLFDNTKAFIADLQAEGRKVICYFSAGSYEDWRDDADDFDKADLGKDLEGWAGEKWLNVKSSNVRKIMQERLDVAVEKGCDGVDPDNTDGYDNENGLGLTEDDATDYVNWLARQAHKRGLSVGLKNSAAIISSVIDNMQWCVNEQCAQYDECDTYEPFIDADKPVFQIEYPKGDNTNDNKSVSTKQANSACTAYKSGNFSTVIKNMDLDNWVQYCP